MTLRHEKRDVTGPQVREAQAVYGGNDFDTDSDFEKESTSILLFH